MPPCCVAAVHYIVHQQMPTTMTKLHLDDLSVETFSTTDPSTGTGGTVHGQTLIGLSDLEPCRYTEQDSCQGSTCDDGCGGGGTGGGGDYTDQCVTIDGYNGCTGNSPCIAP